ncbi:MAG: oligoribonuclease [Candidatus Ancillula sp.]|jgi:oligoribonuclease|nr:oligoribonuclease [Candidatus Ancillula sp.]
MNEIAKRTLIWIDCEMTGLEKEDELLEISVVPTDMELNFLDDKNEHGGIDIVIKPTENGFKRLEDNEVVKQMHTKSGLYEEIKGGVDLGDVENIILNYIKKFASKPFTCYLAGNSVYVDRRFLDAYLPNVSSHLHYRLVDVTAIKILYDAWFPDAPRRERNDESKHRALDDILESIKELKFYKNTLFNPISE